MARDQFFRSRVLQHLHPGESDCLERPEVTKAIAATPSCIVNDVMVQPHVADDVLKWEPKVYTASLPGGGLPIQPEGTINVASADEGGSSSHISEDDLDTGSVPKKRRRRKKPKGELETLGGLKTKHDAQTLSPQGEKSGTAKMLTKNQKRKLKKKRHKEKVRSETVESHPRCSEFTVEVLTPSVSLAESNATKRIEDLKSFFDAVWEVYERENCLTNPQDGPSKQRNRLPPEAYREFQASLSTLSEDCSLLDSAEKIKRFVLYNNKRQTKEEIDALTKTTLAAASCRCIAFLCEYWWDEIAAKT